MGKENELIEKFVTTFGSSFYDFRTEVTDSSGKNRIDMICYVTKDISLGLEFKKENNKNDRRHGSGLGKWLKQAERYTTAEFYHQYHGTYERMPIFVIPSITYKHLVFVPDVHLKPEGHPASSHNNVNSFIFSAFRIGEFRKISVSEYIFSANCKTVATILQSNGEWVCHESINSYMMVCRWLGITTDYIIDLEAANQNSKTA